MTTKRQRQVYDPQYRNDCIALWENSKKETTKGALAAELGLPYSTLTSWIINKGRYGTVSQTTVRRKFSKEKNITAFKVANKIAPSDTDTDTDTTQLVEVATTLLNQGFVVEFFQNGHGLGFTVNK